MNHRLPHWPIDDVKELTEAGHFVLLRTRAAAFFSSETKARQVAREVLMELVLNNFSETVRMDSTHEPADVYGIVHDGEGWYLKLTLRESIPSIVVVISLHPTEHPIVTRGGVVSI